MRTGTEAWSRSCGEIYYYTIDIFFLDQLEEIEHCILNLYFCKFGYSSEILIIRVKSVCSFNYSNYFMLMVLFLSLASLGDHTEDPVKSMENTGHIRYKQ
jgi:hypothetical protein